MLNRRQLVSLLGLGVLARASKAVAAAPLLPERGRPQAPAVRYPDLDGGYLELPTGEIVLLNFWASWCPPCVAELPSLNHLYDNGRGPSVISVNIEQTTDEVREFLQKVPIDYPVVRAPAADMAQWRVLKMPTTVILDAAGRICFRATGERDWSDGWAQEAIESLK